MPAESIAIADTIVEVNSVPLPAHGWLTDTLMVSDIDSALSMPPVVLTYGDSVALGMAQPLVALKASEPEPWLSGIEGDASALRPGTDSALLLLVSVIFVLVIFSFSYCKNMLGTFRQELFDTRQRTNLFEEHTANEKSVVALLAVQLSVCVGILLYCLLAGEGTIHGAYSMGLLLQFMGLYALYYLFRIGAYSVVGYTFTSHTRRRIWLQGFTASQSLLALALPLPTLAAIFFPQTATAMLAVAGVLYLAAEFVFIIKGFRIFYHKFYSLIYFILYLCTLEIIPILAIYNAARLIS